MPHVRTIALLFSAATLAAAPLSARAQTVIQQRDANGRVTITVIPDDLVAPRIAPPPAAQPGPPQKIPANHGFASDVQLNGPITPLVDALHSLDFQKRDEATRTLMRLSFDRLPEIRAALAKETDPEAVTRLTTVTSHLFLKARTSLDGPASLLGIKLVSPFEVMRLDKQADLRMTVVVADLQPGYPAAQELRVGDRIIAIDGRQFSTDFDIGDFRARVNAKPPGSMLRVTVFRDGKQLDVAVQMAGLPDAGPNTSADDPYQAAVDARATSLNLFLAGLDVGLKEQPLVLKTPPATKLFEMNPMDGPIPEMQLRR